MEVNAEMSKHQHSKGWVGVWVSVKYDGRNLNVNFVNCSNQQVGSTVAICVYTYRTIHTCVWMGACVDACM